LAPYIIQQYPNARVAQLGDSLAFVFHRPVNLHTDYRAHDNFPSWIPELGRIRHGEFMMERFYGAVARSTLITVLHSSTRCATRCRSGSSKPWAAPTDSGRTRCAKACGASRRPPRTSVTTWPAGRPHCVTPFDRFYTYRTNGVRLRNWAASLESGARAATIQCTRCDVAGEGP
jgi:hypothetical protein